MAGAMLHSKKGPPGRTRYACRRLGSCSAALRPLAFELTTLLARVQALGWCPVLSDGFCAGNAALSLGGGALLVSPSGRLPVSLPEESPKAWVEVVEFDPRGWSVSYRSTPAHAMPTSDAPLHWTALVEAPLRFGWGSLPRVALHGHALAREDAALKLGLPLSPRVTETSTPADREALLELLGRYPYPEHDVYVRREHGFFLLASDVGAAALRLVELGERARRAGLSSPQLTQSSLT